MANQSPNDDILTELPGLITLYKDGRVVRHSGVEKLPSGTDPATSVISKDVVISRETGVSARLYLPPTADQDSLTSKLPLLVYFHGGGFVLESAASPSYHPHLNTLVAKAGAIAVSVDNRLAPENPVPISHQDCWSALQWVALGGDPWLTRYADFDRIFLVGDSAGANIVHHMAMLVGGHFGIPDQTLDINSLPIAIFGVILVHPYFLGSVRTEKEAAPENSYLRGIVEGMWRMSCPTTSDLDDPIINPLALEAPSLAGMGCRRVFIAVAGEDPGRDEALKKSGWGGKVEIEEINGQGHMFHLLMPEFDASKLFARYQLIIAMLSFLF